MRPFRTLALAALAACTTTELDAIDGELLASAPATPDVALPAPLPDGSTTASGALAGHFAVTPTGAATYTIPIEVPRGRRGLEPALAITYDSQGGDGELGVGFQLAGARSAITRCARNLSNDGVLGPLTWTTADRLCLDGARLVLKAGSYHGTGAEYRTERDRFARIVQVGAPARHFLVYERGGRILRYGSDGSCATCASTMMARDGVIRGWALEEIRDRFGNTMTVHHVARASTAFEDDDLDGVEDYVGAPETVEHYPDYIVYGDGRMVDFTYGSRVDHRAGWRAGIRVETTKRLVRITTSVDGQLVRSYQLGYRHGAVSGRSLLASVTECAADGVCKPATTFEWQDGTTTYLRQPTGVSAPLAELDRDPAHGNTRTSIPILGGDFDGDGRADLLYPKGMTLSCPPSQPCTRTDGTWRLLRSGTDGLVGATEENTGVTAAWPFQAIPLFHDDDGAMDALLLDTGPTWRVLRRGRTLIDTGLTKRLGFITDAATFARFVRVADFTGDGLHDLAVCQLRAGSTTQARWHFRFNTGSGFGPEQELPTVTSPTDCRDDSTLVADVDGDGATDLLLTRTLQPTWGVLRFTGPVVTWSDSELPTVIASPSSLAQTRTVDLNGDGLHDVLTMMPGPGGNQVRAWINVGGRFAGGPEGFGDVIDSDFGQYAAAMGGAQVVDHDGDRIDDLFIDGELAPMVGCIVGGTPRCPPVRGGTWEILVNDGRGELAPLDTGIPYREEGNGSGAARRVALDDDGDLLPDLAVVEDSALTVLRHDGVVPDLLTRIRDGRIGMTPDSTLYPFRYSVGITYRSTADAATYAGTALVGETVPPCVAPTRCGNPMLMVVRSHSQDHGLGTFGTNHFDHVYLDARRDRKGRGFLGFGQHKVEEPDNRGSFTLARHDNFTYDAAARRYPFQGHLLRTTRSIAAIPVHGGRQITITTTTPARVTQGASFFTYTADEDTRVHELGSGPEETAVATNRVSWIRRSTVVDDLGNPISETVRIDGAVHDTVATTYTNDLARWLIGLPTAVVETSFVEATPVARRTDHTYDVETGALATTTTDLGLVTRYTLDGYGNVVETTAQAGTEAHTTTVTYDDEGVFPYATTNALGHVTRQIFDRGRGVLLVEVDANGAATRHAYDGFGRPRRRIGPDGVETTTTYARVIDSTTRYHDETTIAVAGGRTTTTVLDRLGRVVRTDATGWNGGTVRATTTYDPLGLVASRAAPYLVGSETPAIETYVHDGVGRLRLLTRADGTTVQTSYRKPSDEPHLVIATRDELGRWNARTVDTLQQVIESRFDTDAFGRGPAQGRVRFTYGAFGAPRTVTDALGNVTTTTTDPYGRVLSTTEPSAGTRTYTYDGFGRRTSARDGAGALTTYSYDALDRLIATTGGLEVKLGYDAGANGLGKLTGAASPWSAESHTYDAAGRLVRTDHKIGSVAVTEQWSYDSLGRLARRSVIVPGETRFDLDHSYDAIGTLVRVGSGAATYWTLGALGGRGQVLAERHGNGLATVYDYDPERHWLTGTRTGALQSLVYEHDARGNLFRRLDRTLGGYEWFEHDRLDRLTAARVCFPATAFPCNHPSNPGASEQLVRRYAYDLTGNQTFDLLAGAHVYDPARPQLLTATALGTYSYDASGNTIARPTPQGPMVLDYAPGFAKPIAVRQPGRLTRLGYDAMGTRVVKDRVGVSSTVYAGGLYERERLASGAVVHRLRVDAMGRAVAAIERSSSSETVSYVHTDHLGSGTLVTGAAGEVVARTFYDGFGIAQRGSWAGPIEAPAEPAATVGFTGRDHDPELDLVDLGGRLYDPRIARFLTADPFVQAPADTRSHNRYSYAWNNPLVTRDPSGFTGETPTLAPAPSGSEPTGDYDGDAARAPCDSADTCAPAADVSPSTRNGDRSLLPPMPGLVFEGNTPEEITTLQRAFADAMELAEAAGDTSFAELFDLLASSGRTITVERTAPDHYPAEQSDGEALEHSGHWSESGNTLYWDPGYGAAYVDHEGGITVMTPAQVLSHEIGHVLGGSNPQHDATPVPSYHSRSEHIVVTGSERALSQALGMNYRVSHGDGMVPVACPTCSPSLPAFTPR